MDGKNLIKYVEKIYAWSIKKTNNPYEAEELSQQIMLEALSSLDDLRNEKAFHGWLWSLAKNVYKHWIYTESRFNYYNVSIYQMDILSDEFIDIDLEHKEDQIEIKNEISRLSSTWREIVVSYYFDEKTIAEIAKNTGLSIGTIKWRLHEARDKIKKEMKSVEENKSNILKPIKLDVMMLGKALDRIPDMNNPLPPLPHSYIENAVAQNIAAAAYNKPSTIEQISRFTGIPAYYIEEEIKLLEKNELMSKKSNRYQTDFIIIKNTENREIHNILQQYSSSIASKLIDSINSIEKDIRTVGFYGSNMDFNELMWALIPFTFRETKNDVFQSSTFEWLNLLPKRNNGGRWCIPETAGIFIYKRNN